MDLSLVAPTGPQGRVLKGDVLEFIRVRTSRRLLATGENNGPASWTDCVGSPHLACPPLYTLQIRGGGAAPVNGFAPAATAAAAAALAVATATATTTPPLVAPAQLPLPLPPSPLSAAVLTQEKRVPVRGALVGDDCGMRQSSQMPAFVAGWLAGWLAGRLAFLLPFLPLPLP